jgi:hypothetical protein
MASLVEHTKARFGLIFSTKNVKCYLPRLPISCVISDFAHSVCTCNFQQYNVYGQRMQNTKFTWYLTPYSKLWTKLSLTFPKNLQQRNAGDRELLKKSITEPIHLRGHEGKRVLSAQMVNETILLSDILEINEFQGLDLLITGMTLDIDNIYFLIHLHFNFDYSYCKF